MKRWKALSVSALLTFALARPSFAEDTVSPAASAILWGALQLIPSPLLSYGSRAVNAGAEWQVTPLLLSFGIAKNPVRSFVVTPIARLSGSVEFFLAPAFLAGAPHGETGWLGRGGARLYLPIKGRGESLAWSVGGSYFRAAHLDGVAAEIGIYAFFGGIGLTTTISPMFEGHEIITSLHIRYY